VATSDVEQLREPVAVLGGALAQTPEARYGVRVLAGRVVLKRIAASTAAQQIGVLGGPGLVEVAGVVPPGLGFDGQLVHEGSTAGRRESLYLPKGGSELNHRRREGLEQFTIVRQSRVAPGDAAQLVPSSAAARGEPAEIGLDLLGDLVAFDVDRVEAARRGGTEEDEEYARLTVCHWALRHTSRGQWSVAAGLKDALPQYGLPL